MNLIERSDIASCTIALYIECFGKPSPIGSGILIKFGGTHLLITAFHIFDSETERINIENDPDEKGIPQDDKEGIMAKGNDMFFYINDSVEGVVGTFCYNTVTRELSFNENIEWCVCRLSDEVVRFVINKGKRFYIMNDVPSLEIKSESLIILSGYPKYAQKDNQERYRSYKSELIGDLRLSSSGLFKVHFDRTHAYNFELDKEIQIPKIDRISGMSGGGLWYKSKDGYMPIGIILVHNPSENFVEGYNLGAILSLYFKK